MDNKAPEAVEQCDDDSSQWELSGQCDDDSSEWELSGQCDDDSSEWGLRLSQLQLMELSAAQLEEADGGQCPAAILN